MVAVQQVALRIALSWDTAGHHRQEKPVLDDDGVAAYNKDEAQEHLRRAEDINVAW